MGSFPTLLAAVLTSSTGVYGLSWPAAVGLTILAWIGASVVFVYIWHRFQQMVERKRVISAATVSILRDGADERGGAASQVALIILAVFGGFIVAVALFGEPVADEPEARPAATTIVTTTTQAPTTTTTAVEEELDGELLADLAVEICDMFEWAFLDEMVPIGVEEADVTEFQILVLIGGSVTYFCPEQIDQFTYELYMLYPQYANEVVESITDAEGSNA